MAKFFIQAYEPKELRWWYDHRDDLDLEPKYQRRGGIWSARDKAFLIDSIINGYDIPKMYIADLAMSGGLPNERGTLYAVIDGKQRFGAIFDFFAGRLRLASDFVYEANPGLALKGKTFDEIRRAYPNVALLFEGYELSVMRVVTSEAGKIENLFIRLNRGKALTGAEIRNAMPGVVPTLVRQLADHVFFASYISFGVKRYEDRNTATKLLLFEHKGDLANCKKSDLDQFVQSVFLGEVQDLEPYYDSHQRVMSILDTMCEKFRPRDPLLRSSGAVPLYYWLVRQHSQKELRQLRASLEEFECLRHLNRDQPEEFADRELLRFDTLRRSPNDQASLRELYGILERRLIDQSAGGARGPRTKA